MPEFLGYRHKYGGFRMNPWREAENHPLFYFYHDFWKYLTVGLDEKDRENAINFLQYTEWKIGWAQANIPEMGDHFSRDNQWGIFLLRVLYGLPVEHLRIFYWNGKCNWHWNNWAALGHLKGKFINDPIMRACFYPITRLAFLYSDKIDDYFDPFDTDGNLLWCSYKYFVWNELPTQEDRDAFRNYITEFGYWDFAKLGAPHPILAYIDEYESESTRAYVDQ